MITPKSVHFEELERTLLPFIARRVASQEDARDVLQDVLLRIHRGLCSLKDEHRLGPWVYQLTRNAVADHHRVRARRVGVEAPASSELLDGYAEPVQLPSVEQEIASQLSVFVADLPEPYRQTLELTELRGLTQPQAAERLGIGLSATKARVRRGRALLKQALEACCELSLDGRGSLLDWAPRRNGVAPKGCCK